MNRRRETLLIKNFSYTPAAIAALEETISPDRLTSHLVKTQGNKADAFQLYAWNATVRGTDSPN